MYKLMLAVIIMIFYSCTPNDSFQPTAQMGYSPVYASPEEIARIKLEPARNTQFAGKIYAFRNYIFQNELNEGIHIINNTNRNQPRKDGFLKVPFSTEIAIKGNFLYTNNVDDLVVFDISDMANPRLVKRIEKVFATIDQQYPPFHNTVFECPDPSKGIVVRWERKEISKPKCRRN